MFVCVGGVCVGGCRWWVWVGVGGVFVCVGGVCVGGCRWCVCGWV